MKVEIRSGVTYTMSFISSVSNRSTHSMAGLDPAIQEPRVGPKMEILPTPEERASMLANYAEWVRLLEHAASRIRGHPSGDVLKLDRLYDELALISMVAGEVGRIYRDQGKCVLRSNVKQWLKDLEADLPGAMVHSKVVMFQGWSTDPARREDVEYHLDSFVTELIDDANLWRSSMTFASRAIDRRPTE